MKNKERRICFHSSLFAHFVPLGGMADPARTASMFAGVAAGSVTNGISIHGNSPQSTNTPH